MHHEDPTGTRGSPLALRPVPQSAPHAALPTVVGQFERITDPGTSVALAPDLSSDPDHWNPVIHETYTSLPARTKVYTVRELPIVAPLAGTK